MQDNGPFQPGQPGYGQSTDPNQPNQGTAQQPPLQPGRRVIEQPYGPPIIIEEPVAPPPLAQTVRAPSQPQGAPPFTPLNTPVQSPPPQAPQPGYGAPYQAAGQQTPYQQGYQTQVPPQNFQPSPTPGYQPYQNAPVAPGSYPPAGYTPTGYPGGSLPPGGYPPQGRPNRGGRPPWALIAGGLAVVVILIAIIAAARGGTSTAIIHGTATATNAKATSTRSATSTPALSGTMTLGNGYTTDSSNDFVITDPTDTFSSSDQFAWVVALNQDVGVLQATIILSSVNSNGTETVVNSSTVNIPDPKDNEFANNYAVTTLMGSSPAGQYKLKFAVNNQIVASASFTYFG